MTSVKGWHTGRLWSMTLSASLRTVSVFFFIIFHRDGFCVCTPHSFISFDCCLLFSICVFISLCVASVALALVFMPGLYSTAYSATFPAFYAVASSLFLLSVCFCFLCFLFYRDDVLCWLLSCPFSSVCFPCLSPISGLIWFGSVYLVTTAGFVADQLMCDKPQEQQYINPSLDIGKNIVKWLGQCFLPELAK